MQKAECLITYCPDQTRYSKLLENESGLLGGIFAE